MSAFEEVAGRELAAAEAHAAAKDAAMDTFGLGKPVVTFNGPFQLYFNSHSDAPRVWTIAGADRGWEINVATVDLRVSVVTRYELVERRAGLNGPPSAWLEGAGHVQVGIDGAAVITMPMPEASR